MRITLWHIYKLGRKPNRNPETDRLQTVGFVVTESGDLRAVDYPSNMCADTVMSGDWEPEPRSNNNVLS